MERIEIEIEFDKMGKNGEKNMPLRLICWSMALMADAWVENQIVWKKRTEKNKSILFQLLSIYILKSLIK